MSRRKQTKPQHLKSDLESPLAAIAYENAPCGEKDSADNSDEETHVCERCRVPFSGWPNLCEHQKNCTMSPAVLALSEDEGMPLSRESPAGLSPAPSCISEAANSDHTEESYTLTTAGVSALRPGGYDAGEDEGPQELLRLPGKADDPEQSADWGESAVSLPQISTASSEVSYDRPNTNVTLETLHSTRVAVAQFSQGVHTGSASGSTAMAIPRILEQLMSLQQQQIHQLQLIELIRGQVATMNKQPTLSALAMAADSTSAPNQSQLKGFISPPVHPSLTMMPVLVNGEDSVSKTSSLEPPQSHNSQPASRQFNPGMSTCTSVSASFSPPPSNNNMVSSLLPHYTNTSNSCPQELNSLSPLSLGCGNMTDLSSSMPLPPQSSSSTVIFPNPLASIVATTNALDTLSVLMKHRRGKPSNVSTLDTKPRSEDSFFKHKCRFCAKVFGSDSALQIHLRSHTGERPFKCNVCGNRFSTKGNLKVHFQRHKEKHPHIQMNPNPVPEYLDNMPTSSGVPYGMSFPPEKPTTTWLDCKPVLPTVPTSVGLQLPSPLSTVGGYSGSPSLTPLNRSPQRPSPPSSECASLSPHLDGGTPTAKDSTLFWKDPSIDLKQEGTHLPKNCINGLGEKPPSVVGQPSTVTETHVLVDTGHTTTTDTTSSSAPSTVYSPMRSMMSDQFKVKFPFGGVLDNPMQTSETSKLQQLVENIDKKITDPNQCVICHRVLSCQSALKMHYRIHTGERPFKCKVCGRAFTTKGNLKTHFGVHRSKPPLRIQHSCPICQKKFTNAVVLQQHIRMHMGGQIPNTPLQEDVQDMDTGFSFEVEKGFSAISNYDDELMDDNCMEDETEPMEGDISCCSTSAIPSQPIISIIASLEKQTRSLDSTEGSEHFTNDQESYSEGPSAISESSSYTQALSPSHSQSESLCSKSPGVDNAQVFPEGGVTAKSEKQESSPVALDLIAFQPGMSVIKEETPLRTLVLSKEHGSSQSTPSPVTTTASSFITFEINGHSKPVSTGEGPHLRFGNPIPAVPQAAMSPGVPYTLAPPQSRRTSKQHNCHSCGKNFSSASALQIHERTHTGEKPFGCSVCGRAFTTKGNLKVHMGTHVWSNTPARRGRRLSVENPLTLLGGNAMKFSEMFQKDQAVRAINLAPGFWTQYATAITNSLTMKSKEISAFQNGGVSQLPISLGGLGGGIPCLGGLLVGMDKTCTGNTSPMMSLENTNTDVRAGHHFSRFIEDNKGIEIN